MLRRLRVTVIALVLLAATSPVQAGCPFQCRYPEPGLAHCWEFLNGTLGDLASCTEVRQSMWDTSCPCYTYYWICQTTPCYDV